MILGTGANVIHKGANTSHALALLECVALLLCLCVNSWGACTSNYINWGCERNSLWKGYCQGSKSGYTESFSGCGCSASLSCPASSSATKYVIPTSVSNIICRGTNDALYSQYYLSCDTQAEADSVYCAQNPSAEGCVEEDVPPACEEQYSSCLNAGGVWKKVGTSGSNCTSVCDLCGSGNAANFMNRLNSYCCNQPGMAPPDSAAQCYTPSVIPNDMTVSTIVSSRNEVIAGCSPMTTSDGQMIDESAANYKRFCIDKDEYEEQADTNSTGSSSSGGEGESASSSADAGTNCVGDECLPGIYGVLDTIRDTLLKRLTPATEEIRDCLYNARLCLAFDSIKVDWTNMPKDSSWLHIDTTLLKYIKPLMDSSVALDSHQLKVLKNLDTNMLKQMGLDTAMLKLDSAMLRNDSSTRKAIVSGDSGIMKRVGNVDTSVRRLDSSLTKSLGGIDTTLHSLDSSLNRGVRDGVDSLIDSMSRYIGRADSSIRGIGGDGTPLGDSLGSIHGAIDGVVNSLDSSIRSGYGSADTGSGNFPWISQGESQRDSILGGGPGGTGFGGLDFGGDSAWMDSMENIGYTCDGDSCCIGDKCEYFESDSMIVDSLRRHAQRLGDSVRALNDAFYRDSVDDIFTEVKDSLKAFNPLHIFDSTLLSELGASLPNSNTCPEHCSTFQVDIPFFFGTQHVVIDWGLCMGRTAFANGNVLSFLRFIIRIIVAVTCITAVMWNATRIRR